MSRFVQNRVAWRGNPEARCVQYRVGQRKAREGNAVFAVTGGPVMMMPCVAAY